MESSVTRINQMRLGSSLFFTKTSSLNNWLRLHIRICLLIGEKEKAFLICTSQKKQEVRFSKHNKEIRQRYLSISQEHVCLSCSLTYALAAVMPESSRWAMDKYKMWLSRDTSSLIDSHAAHSVSLYKMTFEGQALHLFIYLFIFPLACHVWDLHPLIAGILHSAFKITQDNMRPS